MRASWRGCADGGKRRTTSKQAKPPATARRVGCGATTKNFGLIERLLSEQAASVCHSSLPSTAPAVPAQAGAVSPPGREEASDEETFVRGAVVAAGRQAGGDFVFRSGGRG